MVETRTAKLSGQTKGIMLQGSKLGRELLHLLNALASFYPVYLAQFQAGDDNPGLSAV
jgi:hypothetical protein